MNNESSLSSHAFYSFVLNSSIRMALIKFVEEVSLHKEVPEGELLELLGKCEEWTESFYTFTGEVLGKYMSGVGLKEQESILEDVVDYVAGLNLLAFPKSYGNMYWLENISNSVNELVFESHEEGFPGYEVKGVYKVRRSEASKASFLMKYVSVSRALDYLDSVNVGLEVKR